MDKPPHAQQDHDGEGEFVLGVAVALMIAIPFWAGVGIAAIFIFQNGPITRGQSTALILGAVIEIMLLRYVWRAYRLKFDFRDLLTRYWVAPAPPVAQSLPARRAFRSTLKQSGLLAGLVAAYLHYYYWDVQVQIASLNHLTVFVPTPMLG
jgi:hypothetical protein